MKRFKDYKRAPSVIRDEFKAKRYSLSLLYALVALLLNQVLQTLVERNLFFLSIATVALSSSMNGFGPGVVTTLVTVIGLNMFIMGSFHPIHPDSPEEMARLLIFTATGLVMTFLGSTLRKALLRAEKAKIQADEALRSRDEFISIVSHELRTPLNSLKFRNQLTLRSLEKNSSAEIDRAEHEKVLRQTGQTLDRLHRLLDDLSDFSRITHGKMRIETEIADLATVVQTVVERFEAELQQKGIKLSAHFDQEVVVSCDPGRIEQVLTNLISNAVKYGASTPIEIGLHKTDTTGLFFVRDHGPGIPPESVVRIFDRFERGSKEKQITGLGLGLYITRKVVELHQGKIWVESEVGKGTTFYVELPLLIQSDSYGLIQKVKKPLEEPKKSGLI